MIYKLCFCLINQSVALLHTLLSHLMITSGPFLSRLNLGCLFRCSNVCSWPSCESYKRFFFLFSVYTIVVVLIGVELCIKVIIFYYPIKVEITLFASFCFLSVLLRLYMWRLGLSYSMGTKILSWQQR